MKPLTLTQKTKVRFASNQQFIQQELNLTELEHNELLLEIGCRFLENEFPRNNSLSEKWYLEYAYSNSFWKWWKLEWNNWLSLLIEKQSFYNGATIEKAMEILLHRSGTKESFNKQYIKTLHNGNTRI
tara:strand:+ start:218 stop:601 length:384 start_codon:yes stop_codon:yes gene_type:complete